MCEALALIGLLLVVGCLALSADVVTENAGHLVTVFTFQEQIANRPVSAIYVGGAVTGLLLALGLGLFLVGIARRRSRRGDRRRSHEQDARTPAPVTPLPESGSTSETGTERSSA